MNSFEPATFTTASQGNCSIYFASHNTLDTLFMSGSTNRSEGYDLCPDEDRGPEMSRGYQNGVVLEQTVPDFIGTGRSQFEPFVEVFDETPSRNTNMELAGARINLECPQCYEEANRLMTFNGTWQSDYHVNPNQLARNGFVYCGPGDRVQCVFCLNQLWDWENGDNVEREHQRYYPNCPFVMGQCEQLNVPAGASELQNMQTSDRVHVKTSDEPSANPSVYSGRLQSFRTCSNPSVIRPEALASAGFSYMEELDCVQCFSCQTVLELWQQDFDPWVQHAKYSPKCPFVLSIKGKQFVTQVQERAMEESRGRASYLAPREAAGAGERTVSDQCTGKGRPLQQGQEARSQIDDDLKNPAVLAVMQTYDISVEEMAMQLEQFRINKGPSYKLTSKDFEDLLH